MTDIGTLMLEDAAREMAGNWRKFECFAWHRSRELDDPGSWGVAYTHNRDSGLLDVSNASVIAEKLGAFVDGDDPDVVEERHSHFAVGYLDGFSIRVFKNDEITEAFRAYHTLAKRMANYPILNEEDYSRREYEATVENIGQAVYRLRHEFNLPDGWESEVFSWLWETNQRAVENRDDHGGSPSEDDLRQAFGELGYPEVEGAD